MLLDDLKRIEKTKNNQGKGSPIALQRYWEARRERHEWERRPYQGKLPKIEYGAAWPEEESAIKANQVAVVRKIICDCDQINSRDRMLLYLRFGFIMAEELTASEIAELYGVTSARIHQILAKAMNKLAHADKTTGSKLYEIWLTS